MNTQLFRKSSLDRVNSPEQLNEYIRVTNPSVWLILAAIVLLLCGVLIWGIWGSVETKVSTCVVVEGNTAVCFVSAEDAELLKPGMTVHAGGAEGTVKRVETVLIRVDESFDDYTLYLSGFAYGDFCCPVEVELRGAEDGIYPAEIISDAIHPISFIIH